MPMRCFNQRDADRSFAAKPTIASLPLRIAHDDPIAKPASPDASSKVISSQW